MSQDDALNSNDTKSDEVQELPQRTLATYARLWQLETWLRRMVYVELRALRGDDWSKQIKQFETSLQADKQLSHMPTPEIDPLSYVQLKEIRNLIDQNWIQFSPYLPPQKIWEAKLDEVSQIRHRVAHFRSGHRDDYQRVVQLLRDVDQGFWKFCTSYNNSQPVLPATNDPVTAKFLKYDPFPWREIGERKWARVGHADPSMAFGITVETLRRPWVNVTADSIDGAEGYLYDVQLFARDGRQFDYQLLLSGTKQVHPHIVHLCLSKLANSFRVTIPAILGANRVSEIIERMVEVAEYTVQRGPILDLEGKSVQQLSDDWPEYVLGPEHPLAFLSPDMQCTFFNVH